MSCTQSGWQGNVVPLSPHASPEPGVPGFHRPGNYCQPDTRVIAPQQNVFLSCLHIKNGRRWGAFWQMQSGESRQVGREEPAAQENAVNICKTRLPPRSHHPGHDPPHTDVKAFCRGSPRLTKRPCNFSLTNAKEGSRCASNTWFPTIHCPFGFLDA